MESPMNQMSKITVTANRRTYPWPNVPAIALEERSRLAA
jgi:hypothetical protein